MPKYVKISCGRYLEQVVMGFENELGFPQVVGAIDGTHIPIIRPQENATDFYNRKGFHSIIMQAAVDHHGLFLDIYLGWPGKVHDARVLVYSDIYRLAMAVSLFPSQTKCIGGTNIPLMILGDPAHPLLPWSMKPYPEHIGMDRSNRPFKYRLSHARIVIIIVKLLETFVNRIGFHFHQVAITILV